MAERQGSHVVDDKQVHVTSVLTAQHERAIVSENATVDDGTLAALGTQPSSHC